LNTLNNDEFMNVKRSEIAIAVLGLLGHLCAVRYADRYRYLNI